MHRLDNHGRYSTSIKASDKNCNFLYQIRSGAEKMTEEFHMVAEQMVRALAVLFCSTVLLIAAPPHSMARSYDGQNDEFDACLAEKLKSAENDVTVGQIRKACEADLSVAPTKQDLPGGSDENALERRVTSLCSSPDKWL